MPTNPKRCASTRSDGGPRRRDHRQHLRGDGGSRAPGAAGDPQGPHGKARGAHHRHRLRGADRAGDALPRCPRSITSSATRRRLQAETYRSGLRHRGDAERVKVNDIMSGARDGAAICSTGFGGRARAFVQVQNGCDHRCTFCIIPFGRGNSRSVPAGEVVAQVRGSSRTAMREVVLTGVDITAYGARPAGRARRSASWCSRFSSCAGAAAAAALLDRFDRGRRAADAAIAEEERLMPHLHLSLQSGDDLILKRMKRRHSRETRSASARRCGKLAARHRVRRRPHRRFPTETRGDVRNSLAFVEDCGLTFLHVFPFSARNGTPAARMPQLDGR